MGLRAYPALATDRDKCSVNGKFSARMRLYNEGVSGSMTDRFAGEATSPPRFLSYWDAEQAARIFSDKYNQTGRFPNMSEGAS